MSYTTSTLKTLTEYWIQLYNGSDRLKFRDGRKHVQLFVRNIVSIEYFEELEVMTKLYKKLLAIMNETKAIEKNLTIEFKTAKYKAVSESAVLNEIKPLLKKHGVMILPIETDMEQTGTLTKLTVKWKVVDCESGEFEILSSVVMGQILKIKVLGKLLHTHTKH